MFEAGTDTRAEKRITKGAAGAARDQNVGRELAVVTRGRAESSIERQTKARHNARKASKRASPALVSISTMRVDAGAVRQAACDLPHTTIRITESDCDIELDPERNVSCPWPHPNARLQALVRYTFIASYQGHPATTWRFRLANPLVAIGWSSASWYGRV
jgi:hypothetical protein